MTWGSDWTRGDVEAIAPDASSWKAGAKLADASKWPVLGRSVGVIWGHCQGSGKKPYMTSVDLRGEIAYKCTCPSRKIPCKHALGLLTLGADGLVPEGEPPESVAEWLQKRDGRAEKSAAKRQEITSPVPKISTKRAQNIREGSAELVTWCQDQLHLGLASLQSNASSECHQVAARLVDAGAPGLAASVSQIQQSVYQDDWQQKTFDQLSLLHSLATIVSNANLTDDTPMAGSLRELVGIPEVIDGVRLRPGIEDTWHAVATAADEDPRSNMTVHTTWLYGDRSQNFCAVVEFVRAGAGRNAPIRVGDAWAGVVHPYPGLTLYRVALPVDTDWKPTQFTPPEKLWVDAFAKIRQDIHANPWLRTRLVSVSGKVQREKSGWWFVDLAGDAVPLDDDDSLWSLAAVGFGPIFLRWHNNTWTIPEAQQQAERRDLAQGSAA